MSWVDTTIGQLADVKHGFAFKGEHFSDSGRYVVLTPGNCENAGGFKARGDREKWYSADVPDGYLLDEGALLVVMTDLVNTAPVLGGSFMIPEPDKYLHNQRLGLINVLDEDATSKRFLYYLFNTHDYRGQVRGSASGATVRHTSPGRIKDCRVRIPQGRAEQDRIAAILSAYDGLIENNRRRIALLEEAAWQLYKEWFVRFRFPGHEHVKIIDGVPEGWVRMLVKDAVKRIPAGKLFSQKTVIPTGSVPVLDQGQSGVLGFHDERPSVDASMIDPIIVFANHTCNQRVIHFGFSAIQNVLPYKPSERVPNQIYWLHHATFGLATLNSYKGHWPELMEKDLTVPANPIAVAFSDLVRPMHWQIYLLSRQNEELAKARNLLLSKLMSGAIAV